MKFSNAAPVFALSLFALLLLPGANAAPASAIPLVATVPAPVLPDDPTTPAASGQPALSVLPTGNARSFLWEVKSRTNLIYLFGTIHVGKRTFYPLPLQVEAALKQSPRLVVEADITNNDSLAGIDEIIHYKAPDSLDKHIPAPLFERLKTQLARLHIRLDAVKPMKPYLIGGFLPIVEFSRLGYDMKFGVDGYLIAKAKEADKQILELESQAEQLTMLNGMSPILQEAFLENAISTLESGKAPDQVTGMVNAWQAGDVKLMQEVARVVNKDMRMTDQLDEVLLFSRHDAMLKKIEVYLDGNVAHFVAVGSLHLVGPRGLVEMLKARGFEVKQL